MRTLTSLGAAAALCMIAGSAQAIAGPTITLVWQDTGTSVLDPTVTSCTGGVRAVQQAANVCAADVILLAGTDGVSALGLTFIWDVDLKNEVNGLLTGSLYNDLDGNPGNGVQPGGPNDGAFEFALTEAVLGGKGNTLDPFGDNFGAFGGRLQQESTTGGVSGLNNLFALDGGGTRGAEPGIGPITIGTIAFQINVAAATTDGVDILVGFYSTGVDAYCTSGNLATCPTSNSSFSGLTVNGPAVPEPTTTALMVLGLVGLGFVGRRGIR